MNSMPDWKSWFSCLKGGSGYHEFPGILFTAIALWELPSMLAQTGRICFQALMGKRSRHGYGDFPWYVNIILGICLLPFVIADNIKDLFKGRK